MKIDVVSGPSSQDLVRQLSGRQVTFASFHMNCECAVKPLQEAAIAADVLGATSCKGAMSQRGVNAGVTAFLIDDPDGSYATATQAFDGAAREAAQQAAITALKRADRMGETPDLVWIASTPGHEEEVLEGVSAVFGSDVPIIGGSAADNTIEGNWFVFDQKDTHTAGVAVTVMFPSTAISFAYHNGYSPTVHTGTVTKVSGRRLVEIDNRPALDVYQDWTSGAMPSPIGKDNGTPILSESTFWPLGRETNKLSEVPFYLLAHPATAYTDGSMDLFANVEQGEKLKLMSGTVEGLADRAGRVAALAKATLPDKDAQIAGALMIYCGGCMLGVENQLDRVVSGINDAIGGAPFAGAFTFGEQGNLIDVGNRHGNLMISCIVFGG